MEIQHASLAQVRKGRDGRSVLIEDDVLNIASRLKEIDDSLRLHWNEHGEYFVIAQEHDGVEKLVTTTIELTPAILDHVRRLAHPSYDFVGEIDRFDKQAEKDKDHQFAERVGPLGEKLAHAMRKDLQAKNRIYIPEGYGAT